MIQSVRKLVCSATLSVTLFAGAKAQTLFTCNGSPVSKEDFLKAYSKNNNAGKPTEKSYRDYLELYIRYKLKVRAAYDMQLDTLPGQRSDLQNFRNQVAENYLKDDASLEKLINEAFLRGQKERAIAHILITIPAGASPADTAKAYSKAWSAYNALKKGKPFSQIAMGYSDDPSVGTNGGNIGYISVFALPYSLETLAYTTPVGQVSAPLRTKGGYHIFKVLNERRSMGRIKVAQILLAYPPGATESVRLSIAAKADSVYGLLQNGGDFATLASKFSGDNLTYQHGGEMPEFTAGRYDSAFEAAAFGLTRDGAISRPVTTPFGIHIIKRISLKPAPTEFTTETAAAIRTQVNADPRVEVSRQVLLNKIYRQAGLTRYPFNGDDLWAFTDSAMLNRPLSSYKSFDYNTALFSYPGQQYSIREWMEYARARKSVRNNNTNAELFQQFLEKSSLDYYRAHLESYNPDFNFQLTEFKEGNLLFEVMQRKIWDRASTDSAGLRNYYEAHKNNYWWSSSVDALLFTCNNSKTAANLKQGLSSIGIYNWKQLTDTAGTTIQADSGRYEQTQIPALAKTTFTPGMYTAFVPNKTDNTVSFAYILNVYNDKAPRNYKDARGFVINDYQGYLEDQWISELRKKYPVNIDEKVLASLPH